MSLWWISITAKSSGRRLGAIVVLSAAAALLLPAAAPPAYASEISIAVVGPESGPNAGRTGAIWEGAQAAADTINARGGVRGGLLRLVRMDDGCSAETAEKTAEALAARRVDLVIGHPCSGAAESAAKIYAAKGVIFIATSSRHPGLTSPRPGATIFRIAGRDDRQGDAAAAFLATHFHGLKIALVHDRTRYARSLSGRVATLVENAAGKPPILATLIAGEKDFPRVLEKINEADAVFFAGFPLEAGMLLGQMRAAGSRAAMLFSDSVGSAEFDKTFGRDVRDAFVLRARFGFRGDPVALQNDNDERIKDGDRANAAAAIEAFASAGARADTLAPDKVQIVLNGYALHTPLGVIQFDTNGDAGRPSFDILKWTGHSWEGLNPSPLESLSRETIAQ